MRLAGRLHADVLAAMLLPGGEHQAVILVGDEDRIGHCRLGLAFGPAHGNSLCDVVEA